MKRVIIVTHHTFLQEADNYFGNQVLKLFLLFVIKHFSIEWYSVKTVLSSVPHKNTMKSNSVPVLTCMMGIYPQSLNWTSGNLKLNIQSDERAIANLTESFATACRHCVYKSRCCSIVVVCVYVFLSFPTLYSFYSVCFLYLSSFKLNLCCGTRLNFIYL